MILPLAAQSPARNRRLRGGGPASGREENGGKRAGPILRIGAIGAGAGIAVDALIRGWKTIDLASSGSTRLRAAPIVARRAAGVRVSLAF